MFISQRLETEYVKQYKDQESERCMFYEGAGEIAQKKKYVNIKY